MNNQTPEPLSDNALGELYRRVADERCPDDVDAAVLRLASDATAGWRWQPLMAMAASVVVAVLVGRELDLPRPSAPAVTNDRPSAAAPADARAISPAPSFDDETAVVLDSLRPDAASVQQRVREAAERAEDEVDAALAAPELARQSDLLGEAASRSLGANARGVRSAPDPQLAEELREADYAAITEGGCDAQRSALADLVACYEVLVTAGRDKEAEALLDALRQRFPDVERPEWTH